MRDWFFKGVLPLAFLAFLLYVFKGVYYVDGRIDWFWLWMTAGMPFGLFHFFEVIIPGSMDLTMSLGFVFFQLVRCGIFGGFIAVWKVVKGVFYLIFYPIRGATRRIILIFN